MQPWCLTDLSSVFDSVDLKLLDRHEIFNPISPELSLIQIDEEKLQHGLIFRTPSTVNYQGSLGALQRQLDFNQNSNDSQQVEFFQNSLKNFNDLQFGFQPEGQNSDEVSEEYEESSEEKFKFRFNLQGSSRDKIDLNSLMIHLAPITKNRKCLPSTLTESEAMIDQKAQQKQYSCLFCQKQFDNNFQVGGHVSRAHTGKSENYKMKTQVRTSRTQQRNSSKIVQKGIQAILENNL